VDPPVELRQLRYFVAVAEELHFGRAAERLHMSQSPLSRAIRELERQLGLVLFVRTTRRVELTPAGTALLERARRALAEVELAIDEARLAEAPDADVVVLGHGPFSRWPVTRLAGELAAERPQLQIRLDEDLSPELLHRVATHELAAAAVFASPRAAERHGVRIDVLRDEPLLAALPATHRYADEAAIPIGAFVAECVLLPRDPVGRGFNAWLRAVLRASGFELGETRETLSAPWDRRMVPVADGETASVFVRDWAEQARPRVVAVPFDPPLSFPIDLASAVAPTEGSGLLVEAALRLRDDEGWLSSRPARTQLPDD
jgi:DNA-binding transcriptional LysR family regulator